MHQYASVCFSMHQCISKTQDPMCLHSACPGGGSSLVAANSAVKEPASHGWIIAVVVMSSVFLSSAFFVFHPRLLAEPAQGQRRCCRCLCLSDGHTHQAGLCAYYFSLSSFEMKRSTILKRVERDPQSELLVFHSVSICMSKVAWLFPVQKLFIFIS